MSIDPTTRELLARAGWLTGLPPEALDVLAGAARREDLAAGSVLYAEGDEPTELALVVTGRLRAFAAGGTETAVHREIPRGEPVGEIGVMTGEPRAATVVAVRDSQVLRVPRQAVEAALATAPSLTRGLTRVLVERVREPTPPPARVAAVLLVPLGPGAPADDLAQWLAAAVARQGVPASVPGLDGAPDPAAPDALAELVDRVEATGGVVVLVADGRAPWWDDACARHADRVLLVATGRPPVAPGPAVEGLDRLRGSGVTPERELVLVHPAGTVAPSGTAAWLAAVGSARHHHVREGDARHLDRLARHLLGRSVGLVLSGGGARAMAHLGVYRALHEAGLPIDHVGGSSIGAVVAAQLSVEPEPGALVDENRRRFRNAAFSRRVTLPVVSLLSVRWALRLFDELFGDRDLADAWIPCFVTTVDFSDCTLLVQDRGRAATLTRASASPPGLWPPVVDERGHLIVDGGVLDNLPVGPMRRRGAARVATANASMRRSLAVDPGLGEITSWGGFLTRSLRRSTAGYPTLPALLLRLGLVTSLPAQDRAIDQSDLYIEPAVESFALANYRPFDHIVDAGYRAARTELDRRPDLVATWSGRPPED